MKVTDAHTSGNWWARIGRLKPSRESATSTERVGTDSDQPPPRSAKRSCWSRNLLWKSQL